MQNDTPSNLSKPFGERQATLKHLQAHPEVWVLIVGGGVNGAGLFRDLALQGLDVLLVDKSDICSGASAASSRMIHGGLRYMEFGEFRLVKESLTERNYLLKHAPHYVKPLPTAIPIFARFSGIFSCVRRFLRFGGKRPPQRGSLMVKIGLSLYDLFTRKNRLVPRHEFKSKAKTFAERPLLNPKAICSAKYYDAWISYPERLGLELILDGEKLCEGARALNHVSLHGARDDIVTLCDERTGDIIHVKPKILVNATGGWIDFTNEAIGYDTHMIGGTKGAHLVLQNNLLYESLQEEMVYYENPDGRVAVMLPWYGKVLAGSTDIRVEDPDEVRCEEEEIDYMIESIRGVFPEIEVDRSQILAHFSGVRPLLSSEASATGQVSRDHKCSVIDPTHDVFFSVYSMIGGKWTTFRSFAEQVTDKILDHMGMQRQKNTKEMDIGGGKNYPQNDEQKKNWVLAQNGKTKIPVDRLYALLERYGSYATVIIDYILEKEDQLLKHLSNYSRREIEYLILREKVVFLEDLLLRRTSIALLGLLTREVFDELLSITSETLAWTEEETKKEEQKTLDILKEKFGITLSTSKEEKN